MRFCVFCHRAEGDAVPWCTENPGNGCQYGLHHDYGDGLTPTVATVAPVKQAKKVDKNVCTKCGLHAKNPASAASDCAHEYPA